MLNDFAGCRVTVMGLGRFGGGLGAVRWLAAQGATVLVTDLARPEALAGPLRALEDLRAAGAVRVRMGGHDLEDFTGCDAVVANPAVPHPWNNRYLCAAEDAGVPITTEIRLLLERLDRRRVIGVTGTTGKSTTAAMIAHILRGAGHRVHLGGNLGGSLLAALPEIGPEDCVVLELSSAMLYWLQPGAGHRSDRGLGPHVAVLTNVDENHLDWHETFEHYLRMKHGIFALQEPGDHRISGVGSVIGRCAVELRVPGRHNLLNGTLAVQAAAAAVGLDLGEGLELVAGFPGLPHRLQLVAEDRGMRFIDDSKSTTPPATLAATAAFGDRGRVHLIAGGHDRGADLGGIAERAGDLAGLYTIGATGQALARAAGTPTAAYHETVERAVRAAMAEMQAGEVLLLSPGCASWDQFENYEARGEAFARAVRRHLGHSAAEPIGGDFPISASRAGG